MSATNGHVKTIPPPAIGNETANYDEARLLIEKARRLYEANGPSEHVTALTAMAQVYASLSTAADHDRLASCVPDGGSRFQVATP